MGSFSHRNDDEDLVIAADIETILKVVGGITAAVIGFRTAKWLVPKLWKAKWVILAIGVAIALYVTFIKDQR